MRFGLGLHIANSKPPNANDLAVAHYEKLLIRVEAKGGESLHDIELLTTFGMSNSFAHLYSANLRAIAKGGETLDYQNLKKELG